MLTQAFIITSRLQIANCNPTGRQTWVIHRHLQHHRLGRVRPSRCYRHVRRRCRARWMVVVVVVRMMMMMWMIPSGHQLGLQPPRIHLAENIQSIDGALPEGIASRAADLGSVGNRVKHGDNLRPSGENLTQCEWPYPAGCELDGGDQEQK